ncbi:hypothetical protein GCM10009740_08240 [Terrabacter terrae]|uniref:Uncharacterized protein n=1 Tax=Terrabacter terrae TaxID=318434 RepID=A0ABP5FBZ9_9MICO
MVIGLHDASAAGGVPDERSHGPADGWTAARLADVLFGLAAVALEESRRVTARAGFVTRPLAALAAGPVALGGRLGRSARVADLVDRGERERRGAAQGAYAVAQRVAPRLVDRALAFVDVTEVVARHVDLDALAALLDVDAVVARADLDAVLARVDVDAVVARVDIQRILERVDVDAVVARADLEAVLARVDVDEVVARVDIQRILDRVDVNAVVARADLDAVVARLDLIALAEVVVEGIDLPGIIRSSTGSMASEGIREVRRQGIGADERVAHAVDRLLHRAERAPGTAYEESAGDAYGVSTEERPPATHPSGSGPGGPVPH